MTFLCHNVTVTRLFALERSSRIVLHLINAPISSRTVSQLKVFSRLIIDQKTLPQLSNWSRDVRTASAF